MNRDTSSTQLSMLSRKYILVLFPFQEREAAGCKAAERDQLRKALLVSETKVEYHVCKFSVSPSP